VEPDHQPADRHADTDTVQHADRDQHAHTDRNAHHHVDAIAHANAHLDAHTQRYANAYLDTNAQGVLFYIIEEAVNNARKHAQSQQIWVRLYKREAFVVVEIEDDGVGFDVSAVDASYDQRGSLGMVNMRERAELIEGTLRIQSAKGRGTKISVLVPIERVGGSGAPRGDSGPAPQLNLQGQNTGARRPPTDLDNGDAPNGMA